MTLTAIAATVLSTGIPTMAEVPEVQITEQLSDESVTVYFDDLVLSFDDSYEYSAADDISLFGGNYRTDISSYFWGAYNSADGNYYLQINSGKNVTFKGLNNNGLEVLCNGSDVSDIQFSPFTTNDPCNFTITYSAYTNLGTMSKVYSEMTISGKYNDYQRTFTIKSITYYRQ